MKSAGAIAFDLRPSRLLIVALAGMTGLGIVALWASGFHEAIWLAAAVSLLVVLAAMRSLRRLWRSRWQRASWNADGAWTLVDAAHTAERARLLGWNALGLSLLVQLRSDAGEAVTLYLLPDNLDHATRRQLRVRLAQDSARAVSPTPR